MNQQLVPATGSEILIQSRSVVLARRAREARKYRRRLFGTFARDLPWDILLVLYTSGQAHGIKVASVQADVSAPLTSVLRWLQSLENQGFVIRQAHPTDGRIACVALTSEGELTLNDYFEKVGSL